MADIKDLIIIFAVGFAVGWFLKEVSSFAVTMPSSGRIQENEEVWSWKDWKGRDRQIIVHRTVKTVV